MKGAFIFRLLLVFFILSGAKLTAQNFTASANKTTVAVGERFQLSFTIDANGSQFQAPSFADFNVLMGPSQSTNMQFSNGSLSQTISFTYLLEATKEGTFKIGSASISAAGKKLESNPITITAVKGSQNAQPGQGNQQGGQSNANGISSKDVFLKAIVDKTNVLQGEGIAVSYRLYTKLGISNYSVSKIPDLNGFWSQDIIMPQQQPKVMTENINGVSYKYVEVKKTILFPQRAGTLELDPLEMEAIAQVQIKQNRNFDPFNFDPFSNDPFFGNSVRNVKINLKSDAVKITVRPLPNTNVPATFKGAVGKYSMEVTMDKKETKTNEPVTLKIKLSGKGNLKLLDAPQLKFPSEFDTFEPKVTPNITASTSGVSGSKTFEYLVIPRVAGNYKIPVEPFSYFDLESKKYVTIDAPELAVNVAKGSELQAATSSAVRKEDLQLLGKDIRYIKTNNIIFIIPGKAFFGSLTFWLFSLLPLLLLLLLIIFRRKYLEMQGNVGLMKSRRANKVARKRLSAAQKFLKSNEKEKFLDEMSKALWGFISDKLHIPVADLSKDSALQALRLKNVDESLLQKFSETVDSCEYSRFAPGAIDENEKIYNNGIDVISRLEEAMK